MALPQSFMDKIEFDTAGGCWLWSACVVRHYGQCVADGRRHRSHRYAYEQVKGLIPEGLMLRHTCDVKLCCNPDHLIPGTAVDNARDAAERGQLLRGERIGNSKLKETQVLDILAAIEGGAAIEATAHRYGVVRRTIQLIADGVTWKHLRRQLAA